MKRIVKRLTIRRRSFDAGLKYHRDHPCHWAWTGRDHRRLIRYLRLSKGKPAFRRPECLKGWRDIPANTIETYMLTTGNPPESSPYWPLALMSNVIGGLLDSVRNTKEPVSQ